MPVVRRSFSEPSVVSRRGALELRRESVDDLCVGGRMGFAMAGAWRCWLISDLVSRIETRFCRCTL